MATRAETGAPDAPKGSLSPIRLPAIISEFLGSLFIELVAGVITIVSADSGLVTGAMGVGFAFTTVMFIFRGVSGAHMNPAVTVGVMASSPPLAYDFNLIQGLAYILCQVSGAVTGALLCAHLVPMEVDVIDRPATDSEPASHHVRSVSFLARGVLSSDHGLSVFIFELVCTFAIVWTYFATMIDQRSRKRTGGFGPLAVGLGIIVGILAEGPGTGGAGPRHPLSFFPRSARAGRTTRMRRAHGCVRAPAAHAHYTGCCSRGPRFAGAFLGRHAWFLARWRGAAYSRFAAMRACEQRA